GSTWAHATLSGRSIGRSLLRAAVPAAARRLDPDDVTRTQLARQFRRLLLAVHEGSAGRAVGPAAAARRRVAAALREHREPAILEDAELAHDAVAAPIGASAARAQPQLPAPDQQWVLELDRLGRRRARVRHRA